MARDLHHNIKAVRVISAAALATAGTTGKPVNRQGYESLEFLVDVGTIAATGATLTAKVLEGDATGALATAAAGDVLGTLTLAGATSARASGVSKNFVKRIGYIGKKQYATTKLTPTATGMIGAVTGVLGHPTDMPVAEQ